MISQQETRPRRAIRRRSKYRWRHLLGSGVLFLLMLWFLLLTLFFFSQASSPAGAAQPSIGTIIGYGGYENHQSFSASRGTAEIFADPTNTTIDPTSTSDGSQNGGISMSNPFAINPSQWLWDGITGFFDQLWRQVVDFFEHQIIDLASSFGFLYITPAALSYKNAMVLAGAQWSLMAMDGLVALFLVVAGYQVLVSRYLGSEQTSLVGVALRVVLRAVAANLGFFVFLPQIIELTNTMSLSFLGWMMQQAAGDVTLPLGAVNWLTQPMAWGIFILIHFLVAIFFVFVQVVRLAVLDVTIMLAPWWMMLLGNEYTRSWGRLGAVTFFSALFVQPIQICILSLGAAFISNFSKLNFNDPAICQNLSTLAQTACRAQLGHASISASATPVAIALGIATTYVAMKIPGMLFSGAIRASIGSVNRDVTNAVKSTVSSAMSVVLFNKQLTR